MDFTYFQNQNIFTNVLWTKVFTVNAFNNFFGQNVTTHLKPTSYDSVSFNIAYSTEVIKHSLKIYLG